MRNAGDRLHPGIAVGHEQPHLDQDFKEPSADRIDAEWCEWHAAQHDRLVVPLTGGDWRAQSAGRAA